MGNKSNNIFIFLAIGIILFIDNVDINALGVAIPVIAAEFGADIEEMQWLVNIYFIFGASFFMFSGYIGDRWGLRNTLCFGIALILISSFIGGFANSTLLMLFSRALQGIGYAFTFSMMMLVTNRLLDEKQRNVGMGIFMAVATASAMIGPVLGSVLTHYIGWQAIFFLNVVLCVPCLWILLVKLENFNLKKTFSCNEISANCLFSVGVLGIVFLIDKFSSEYRAGPRSSIFSTEMVVMFAIIMLIVALFYFLNRKCKNPVFDKSIFSNKYFSDVTIFRVLLQALSFSFFFWIPIFLQIGLGYTIIETGFVVAIFTSTSAFCSLLSGVLAEKVGHHKTLALSHSVMIIGMLYLLFNHSNYSLINLAFAFVLIGAGLSSLYTVISVLFLRSLNEKEEGMQSGAYYTLSYVAGSIGVIVTVFLLNFNLPSSGDNLVLLGGDGGGYISAMKSVLLFWISISVATGFFCLYKFKDKTDELVNSKSLM